jgi:hypothetical protein
LATELATGKERAITAPVTSTAILRIVRDFILTSLAVARGRLRLVSPGLIAHQLPSELGPLRIHEGQLVRLNRDQRWVWL